MRKIFLALPMLITALFVFTACEPSANTNTANRPANAGNNTAVAATGTPNASAEAEVRNLVTDLGAAMGRNDADALDKMNSDNFMVVNPVGMVQNKAEWSASLRSGELKFDSFVYDEINVRANPEGTGAVAIGRATVKGRANGQPIDDQVRVTSVWSKSKDGWKAVSAQATRIVGTPAEGTAANPANANRTVTANTTTNANR